jgi:flagellar biosynthesis protein FlhF
MHLKRFRGVSVSAALAAARADLGPNALVLGSRLVPVSGWRGFLGAREVEISAAAERQVSDDRQAGARHTARSSVAASVSSPARSSALTAQLTASGFSEAIAAEILAGVRGRGPASTVIRRAVSAWASHLTADAQSGSRIDVFIGPSGAGKTTTIAKIAARARVEDNARLGLISADAFRVGAIEQLRQYAEIIGSPFAAARTTPELETLLAENTAPVLVDTAGRSPRDERANELLTMIAGLANATVHLVVPGTTAPRALERTIEAHAAARPTRVVFTKIDECDAIAPLAAVLRERGLRVSYLGSGQRVPEDLHKATPALISAALIGDTIWAAEHVA